VIAVRRYRRGPASSRPQSRHLDNATETPANGVDDDGNGFVDDIYGWDFQNKDNDPLDDHSHGTHVAGIARRPL